jgi:predicted phosphodiesterase
MKKENIVRLIGLLLLSVALFGSVAQGAETDKTPVRFAILGDRTGGYVGNIYEGIVTEIARLRPDFVMNVGDMIEGYTDDSTKLKKEWAEYDSIVKGLGAPLYRTPGNHDITTDLAEPYYRRFSGKPYYSFDHNNIHFIILDVSRWESSRDLPKEQLDWLTDDLKQHQTAAQTMVFFHKPFWQATLAQNKPDTLHGIFKKYGVDAVFNGHFHEYFTGTYDGIQYVSVGSSGAEVDVSPTGVQYHFTWVTVDSSGIHVAPIKQGSVLPADEMTIADKNACDWIRNSGLSVAKPLRVDKDLAVTDSVINVILNNSNSKTVTEDTLRWNVPENWKIEPSSVAVKLAAGESKTFPFVAHCLKGIYPVPTASVTFNYAEGKRVSAKSDLRVAREAQCYPSAALVTIDGKINEPVWHDPVTAFFASGGKEVTVEPVKIYFAHDRENLYIAAYCQDSKMESLKAKITEHDGMISGEDCVGFFLEPVRGGDVYQIYINPLGTVLDQRLTKGSDGWVSADKSWNSVCEIKTTRGTDYWTMEAKIPVKQFGATLKSGDDWRLNFRRKQPRLRSSAEWQTPIDYSADTYGKLIIK